MYKILIKYISKMNDIYWKSHMVTNEMGETVEFSTDDFEVLREEIRKLDAIHGHSGLRVINDVTYAIRVELFDDIENVSTVSSEDVRDIYATAFNRVYG